MAKSKKPARNDRQKVIDDIRRKQKRTENRQGAIIITVCVGIALVIVLAAAWGPASAWFRKQTISADSLADIGAAPSVCEDRITESQEGNTHVDQGQQVQYQTAPPATGDHWNVRNVAPVPITQRFYDVDDRPELEQLVHNSEHGYTILWYDPDAVDGGDVAEIQKMADFLNDNDTNFRFKFKAVPWTQADAEEVATNLDRAVASAESQVEQAQTAVDEAKPKDEQSAQQQLTSAQEALESAREKAEKGGELPEGTPYVFTHWTADAEGVWQYCSEPSGEALQEFMFDYPYSDSPEPYAM
ncbi:DUF3105 domain-containing protein [Nocardioides panacisoli]|uniref:DUF3105 domain-containing protein n=1 Tax=Nocardioides panacisoli TaxID=627624 RepID=UPI001C6262E6|nr:DUF3105 domain-containing protein [Nocardioides panacisoli]QYJ04401.1 DUF3105 domain-containing protein [Nocardioides panacisoli]